MRPSPLLSARAHVLNSGPKNLCIRRGRVDKRRATASKHECGSERALFRARVKVGANGLGKRLGTHTTRCENLSKVPCMVGPSADGYVMTDASARILDEANKRCWALDRYGASQTRADYGAGEAIARRAF